MNSKKRYYQIAGIVIVLASIAGALTLDDAKYSTIAILGVVFLLLGSGQNKI